MVFLTEDDTACANCRGIFGDRSRRCFDRGAMIGRWPVRVHAVRNRRSLRNRLDPSTSAVAADQRAMPIHWPRFAAALRVRTALPRTEHGLVAARL